MTQVRPVQRSNSRVSRPVTHGATAVFDDVGELLQDWETHLRARNRSSATIKSYLQVATAFVGYLRAHGMPTNASGIRRDHVEAYLADMLSRGKPSNTAKHYRSLQQLFRWLEDEGEVERSPMARMRPPSVPEQPVPVLRLEDLARLLDTCKGGTFENRRDAAIIRVLFETGIRLNELTSLTVGGTDFVQDTIRVMGKGRREREVPFGPRTKDALRRYYRARRVHPSRTR
jgi:site-specific recombinase XerD